LIKKIATISTAVAILAASAFPVLASANSNASCVGIDVSVEGPEGTVNEEVHVFLDYAKSIEKPLGSLVSGSAKLHLETREACGE